MSEQRDARGLNYSFTRIKGKIKNAAVMNLLLFSVSGRRQDAGDKQLKMWAVNLSANHKYVHIRTCQSVISRL